MDLIILLFIIAMFVFYPEETMGLFELIISLFIALIISIVNLIIVLPYVILLLVSGACVGLFLLIIIACEWVNDKITKFFVS